MQEHLGSRYEEALFSQDVLDDSVTSQTDASELRIVYATAISEVRKVIDAGVQAGVGFKDSSIYTGLAGIALMYLRLAEVPQGLLEQQSSQAAAEEDTPGKLLQQALTYISAAEGQCDGLMRHKRVTFLEGASGIFATKAAIFSRMGRQADAEAAQQDVEILGTDVLQMPESECELLYGRCGYIWALLYARKCTGCHTNKTQFLLYECFKQVVQGGKNTASMSPTLQQWGIMYQWHGTFYLGAAHGLAGILMVLCHALPELYPPNALPVIWQALACLLRTQLPSGNFPSSLGKEKDRLVQWCHGAPGVVPLLAKASSLLSKQPGQTLADLQCEVTAAAESAGECIWQRGILRKGVGLCHGISGNAYAFLALYRMTGKPIWQCRAQQFGLFAAEHWRQFLTTPDEPLSLFEGLAGAVCLWADLLHPETAKFPGYEL